jgi:hypothetical protein
MLSPNTLTPQAQTRSYRDPVNSNPTTFYSKASHNITHEKVAENNGLTP